MAAFSQDIDTHAEGIGGSDDRVTYSHFQRQGIGTFMTKMAIQQLKAENCRLMGVEASKEGMYLAMREKPIS